MDVRICYNIARQPTVYTMKFAVLLSVALGGALGSLLRYFVASAIQSPASAGFPWGIFIVNVTGGFAMGVITELAALKFNMPQELRAFLTVGILGGYTTFSSFSWQTLSLVREGEWLHAGWNVLLSMVLCLVAVWMGQITASFINQR